MYRLLVAFLAGAVVFAKRDRILRWFGLKFGGMVGGGGDWSQGCPPATQNAAINTRNRDATIRLFQYGPANPNLPSLDFWERYAKTWAPGRKVTPALLAEVQQMRCGNCAVFDVSPRMRSCMPPIAADAYDAPVTGAALGYCWAHHFKCASTRTCSTWAAGGPIKDDKTSDAFFQKYGD